MENRAHVVCCHRSIRAFDLNKYLDRLPLFIPPPSPTKKKTQPLVIKRAILMQNNAIYFKTYAIQFTHNRLHYIRDRNKTPKVTNCCY